MDAYACWLANIPGLGARAYYEMENLYRREFQSSCQTSVPVPTVQENLTDQMAQFLYSCSEWELFRFCHELKEVFVRAEFVLSQIRQAQSSPPQQIQEHMQHSSILLVSASEQNFPKRLRGIPDPPYFLFYRGRLPDPDKPACGIVGSRLPSAYGKKEAADFARDLARYGVQIISGMARGVDGIAGRAALETSDNSYAVLGSGVDVLYPPENEALYQELIARGGVISEFPPGTQARAQNFPMRNRIISGLSDVVLVVEAKEKSGSLITADMAAAQGRDVFALPGRITDRTSHGCNQLIRDGAFPATSTDDLLIHLFHNDAEHIRAPQPSAEEHEDAEASLRRLVLQTLPSLSAILYSCLDEATPCNVETLYERVSREADRRISYSELMRSLTGLLLHNLAAEVRVGYYIRK